MADHKRVKKALVISFLVSFLSLIIKMIAFVLTDSVTAMSDAVESIVHVIAVGFVLYGFAISLKPADEDHLYGHERIEFLSVGTEGGVIILAGLTIIFMSIQNAITGFELANLVEGIGLMSVACVVNFALGTYVKKVGEAEDNMMAISNGKHVLTDVWTSLGVIITLFLINLTGWIYLDLIVSFCVGVYIIKEGFSLIKYSVNGIMDTRDPEVHKALEDVLDHSLPDGVAGWHNLRHRTSGQTTWVELHLEFKKDMSLENAHELATVTERKLIDAIKGDAVATVHLEPEAVHEEIHNMLKGANKNRPLDDFI